MKREFSKWEVLCAAPLVKDREGLKLESYYCPAGIPTIGYGHTRGVMMCTRITKEEADRMLSEDLENFKRQVARYVKVPVTKGQFIALLDFAYNLGVGALAGSTLLKCLNAGNEAEAATHFADWILIKKFDENGKKYYEKSKGLIARRELERQYFVGERE